MSIKFEWDAVKARTNARKHGISFEEAKSVFYDENARFMADPGADEERFLLLGISAESKVLVVCHCYRKRDSVIRLISARRATVKERGLYWERFE